MSVPTQSGTGPVCPYCGYALAGLHELKCPECGKQIDSVLLNLPPKPPQGQVALVIGWPPLLALGLGLLTALTFSASAVNGAVMSLDVGGAIVAYVGAIVMLFLGPARLARRYLPPSQRRSGPIRMLLPFGWLPVLAWFANLALALLPLVAFGACLIILGNMKGI